MAERAPTMTTDAEYMRLYRQGQRRPKTAKRETEAMSLLSQGVTIEQVAEQMNVDASTVERYRWRHAARERRREHGTR